MITDGYQYLKRDALGNFIPVKGADLGGRWDQRDKAANVLRNCVNKNLRSRYRITEVDIKRKPKVSEPLTIINNDTARGICSEPLPESGIDNVAASVSNLKRIAVDLEARKRKLNEDLSNIDKEVTDIEHYIELSDGLNAYQGWLAYKMLRSKLKKRRIIKDEIQIIFRLGECKIDSEMLTDIQDMVSEMPEREYHPRVLTELFPEVTN